MAHLDDEALIAAVIVDGFVVVPERVRAGLTPKMAAHLVRCRRCARRVAALMVFTTRTSKREAGKDGGLLPETAV